MKLSADKTSPDYHDVVHYIDQITVDGAVIKHCFSFDTKAGTALCASMPIKDDGNGNVKTHTVHGKIAVTWRSVGVKSANGLINTETLFLHLKADWEERERVRSIATTGETQ